MTWYVRTGKSRPTFVRRTADMPKNLPAPRLPGREKADNAWGMDPESNLNYSQSFSPMSDMSDAERDYEIGPQPKNHQNGQKNASISDPNLAPLASPPVWKGAKKVKDMSPAEFKKFTSYKKTVGAYQDAYRKTRPNSSANVVAHFRAATPDEVQGGIDWYKKAQLVSQRIAKDTGRPVDQIAGLIANYSPQTGWYDNIMRASVAARTGKGIGGKGSHIMASDAQRVAADRILNGEPYQSVLGGRKIGNFGSLIENGGDDDPENPRVVIDRHATGVTHGDYANDYVFGMSRGATTKGGYEDYTRNYVDASKQLHDEGVEISPHQLQAATWLTRQRLNSEGGYEAEETGRASRTRADTGRRKFMDYANQYHPGMIDEGIVPGTGFTSNKGAESQPTVNTPLKLPEQQPTEKVARYIRRRMV